jgi:hypothetical protein
MSTLCNRLTPLLAATVLLAFASTDDPPPQVARYEGSGSIEDAANFDCKL